MTYLWYWDNIWQISELWCVVINVRNGHNQWNSFPFTSWQDGTNHLGNRKEFITLGGLFFSHKIMTTTTTRVWSHFPFSSHFSAKKIVSLYVLYEGLHNGWPFSSLSQWVKITQKSSLQGVSTSFESKKISNSWN